MSDGINSKIARRMRNRVAESQGWRCAYCGCALEPETATLDHLQPKKSGGPLLDRDNLVAACLRCNNARGMINAFKFWHAIQKGQIGGRNTPQKKRISKHLTFLRENAKKDAAE